MRGTPVAPFVGTVAITVRGMMSEAAAVVKLQTNLAASAFAGLAWSWAPVVIVAVNWLPGARLAVGVKVATEPVEMYATVPVIGAPPGPVTVNVVAFIVVEFMDLLKAALITAFKPTLVAPWTGVVDVT